MKKLTILFAAGFVALGLVACSPSTPDTTELADSAEPSSGTVTVTDHMGDVEVPVNPERVVAFDLGILDALDYLDIDIIGLPAVSLPPYLSHFESDDYANAGGIKDIDLEAVYEMQPDVIFISGRQEEFYDDLKEIAPVYFVLNDDTDYMASFEANMNAIGQIFQKEAEVEEVINDLHERMEAIRETVTEAGYTALVTMINEESISAFAAQSRFGIIHNALGFSEADENLEMSGRHGQQISVEYILETNPDFLFAIDRQGAIGTDESAKTILDNELVDTTTAAQNDRIVYLDSTVWYLVSGGITSTHQMIAEVEEGINR